MGVLLCAVCTYPFVCFYSCVDSKSVLHQSYQLAIIVYNGIVWITVLSVGDNSLQWHCLDYSITPNYNSTRQGGHDWSVSR